jgi:predicted GIY-YIG superfamily endonuclease
MYLAEAYCMLELPEKAQECFDNAEPISKEFEEKKNGQKQKIEYIVEQQFNKQMIKEKMSP